ncbi:hypothetical protein EHF33_14210 [Deinococcus psychrotolerans]|uniref:Uncharacterized protein n=1 Tax=Deinococcus psychrotolerans TaxID=2489213 RepID=A0A3G8YFK1_9DEIO|nr:hypothetical protein [Deinococcus psychrotolerans]AZI44068.1 hypothetical protein EHF33_14210 [Deinococcus psychrotolerans]
MLHLIEKGEGRVAIFAPYTEDFADRARKMGAKWREVTGLRKAWCFPEGTHAAAVAAAVEVFGVAPATTDEPRCMSVRVKVHDDAGWSQAAAPALLLGYEIAVARGRDSGARPGEGVSILTGEIGAGGSVKHWTSTVSGGTEILLRDFPASWLDALQEDERIEVLEITRTSDPRSPASHPILERAAMVVELLEQHGLTADVNALAARTA